MTSEIRFLFLEISDFEKIKVKFLVNFLLELKKLEYIWLPNEIFDLLTSLTKIIIIFNNELFFLIF